MTEKTVFRFLFVLGIIVIMAIAQVAFIFPNAKAQAGSDPWWNAGWKYRRGVTIDNTAGGSLANYQVSIVVPYEPSMQPDFSDLRFTDTSGNLLPYWIEKVETGPTPSPSYQDRIKEAAEWIFRAQDANGPFFGGYGGGVSYWSTASGWYGTDYQEVTGYIIPAILDLYQLNGNVTYRDRALSMADWEVSVQNPEGDFLGWPFETAMAMQGLLRAYKVSSDPSYLNAAKMGANWIILHQLPDGSYVCTNPGFPDTQRPYHSRVDWVLLDLYQTTGNTTYRDAALANLAWVFNQQQPNGWWYDETFLHFISYIIQGVLESGVLLQTIDGGAYAPLGSTYINSARKAADALLNQQLSDGSMSGQYYDSNWNPTDATNYLCADAQISTIWARFYQLTGNATYLDPPRKANTFLMSTQDVQTTNMLIRGGIDNSWPLSGTKLAWATKFFIDALINTPEPPSPPPNIPQATLWIKVPSVPAVSSLTVYMYYGNPAASSASNGNAVFDFFDDFSGDLSKWTVIGGTWTIQNGELDASTTNFGERLRANGVTIGSGIVEARMEWISGTYLDDGLCIRGQSDEAANSYVYFLNKYTSLPPSLLFKRSGGSSVQVAAGNGPNPSLQKWYDLKVSASGTSFTVSAAPDYSQVSGTDSSFSTGSLCLFAWSSMPEDAHYDNVRIRKYASPEPTTTIGPEETLPVLFIDPTSVTKTPGDVGTTFTVSVNVGGVTGLFGFDVKITWGNTLITSSQLDNSSLSSIWPQGEFDPLTPQVQSGSGWVRYAALATGGNGFTGSGTLFKITFHIEKASNVPLTTPIHFDTVKLSDSHMNAIYSTLTDGQYTMGAMPDVEFILIEPNTAKPWEYGKYVQVQVNATDITSSLTGCDLTVDYGLEVLTFVSLNAWGVLGTGSVDSSTAGVVHVWISGGTPFVGGSGLLFTLTFQVLFDQRSTHIWTTATIPNQVTTTISLDTTTGSLTFQGGTVLIGHVTTPSALTLTINLIRGDVNCDGKVDVFDLRTVAAYYDRTSSDPQWSTISKYDVKTDNIIDIYDLVIIASNYGYYNPP